MRTIGVRILVVVGSTLLVAGLIAGHVSRQVLNQDAFAGHVQTIRKSDEVSSAAGKFVTAELLKANPDLVAIRPLIEAVAVGVIRSDRLDEPTRQAARTTIGLLTTSHPAEISLTLPTSNVAVTAALQHIVPHVVSPETKSSITLLATKTSATVTTISETSRRVRVAAWLLPLVAALCFAVAIALATDRRKAVTQVGRSMFVGAFVLATALLLAWLYLRGIESDTVGRATIKVLWSSVMNPLWWSVLALAGVAVGVVKLTGATLVPRVPVVTDSVHWVRQRNPIAVGAFGTVVVALGFIFFGSSSDSSIAAPALGTVCNGHAELCDRPYNDVAYATTHNAMSVASSPGWFIPEQADPIPTQLDQGVRGLLIDVWPGRDAGGVTVTASDRTNLARQIIRQDFGAAALTAAAQYSNARAGSPSGPTSLYLCHGLCEIGSESFPQMLNSLHTWMEDNPNEVVTLFIEEYAPSSEVAADIIDAGLAPMAATPPAKGDTWPTLGEMITSGKRLVVMIENGKTPKNAPWMVNGFTITQDTPYTFRSADDFSCDENRGPNDAPLLLVNHWLAGATSLVSNAQKVNTEAVLGGRMRRCQSERGQIPNFVAVNFVSVGDTFTVVDQLNGVK